jgi:hypothetical protein
VENKREILYLEISSASILEGETKKRLLILGNPFYYYLGGAYKI